jgi:hypothetical protein
MGDKFPRWSARNPLGIIALFISLIYGMSALLLGTSVDSLAASNQTILVCFVVSFPFVVLGVFAWFVAKHHKKLYGPADFRSDEAFHAVKDLPPAALGHRLSQETETSEVEPGEQNGAAASEQKAAPATPGTMRELRTQGPGMLRSAADRVTRAFVAEALVLQELQREFGGAIRRQVAVRLGGGRSFRVDGIINVDNRTVAIEVKIIKKYQNLANIINDSIAQAMRYRNSFENVASFRFILAIVVDDGISTNIVDNKKGTNCSGQYNRITSFLPS